MKTKYEQLMADASWRREFQAESLVFEATELIARLMEKENVSKADLAKRLQKTKSHVTQLLSGSRNMTLRTLSDLAFVLGYEVSLDASLSKEKKISDASAWADYEVPKVEVAKQPEPYFRRGSCHWKTEGFRKYSRLERRRAGTSVRHGLDNSVTVAVA